MLHETHESPASRNGRKGQQRHGAKLIMQVHENCYIKRAGVAGLRVRAKVLFMINVFSVIIFKLIIHLLSSMVYWLKNHILFSYRL